LLSTSARNNLSAIKYNCGLSVSLFHPVKNIPSPDIISRFKEEFFNEYGILPPVNIAISGCCFGSEKELKNFVNRYQAINVNFIGTRSQVTDKISAIKQEYDIDEIIILDISNNIQDKLYSLETIYSAIC
jgi:hypothetical protein